MTLGFHVSACFVCQNQFIWVSSLFAQVALFFRVGSRIRVLTGGMRFNGQIVEMTVHVLVVRFLALVSDYMISLSRA